MNFIYDMKDTSDYSLSFTTESGLIIWFQGGIRKSDDYINKALKTNCQRKKYLK